MIPVRVTTADNKICFILLSIIDLYAQNYGMEKRSFIPKLRINLP